MAPCSRRDFLRTGAAVLASAACGPHRREPPADVRAFHDDCLVLDLHIDTLLWMRLFGYDIAAEHSLRLPRRAFAFQMDLPRARRGGLDAAVMGLVINPREVLPELMTPLKWLARIEDDGGASQTLATLDLFEAAAEEHATELAFVRSGSELRAVVDAGRFAGLAGLEGAHGIEDDLAHVSAAWERGLRMIGLVHFQASAAAYPMTVAAHDDEGLTAFGRELIGEMQRLGMVVDLAHVNARGVDDALGVLDAPFVVSHSACRALVDHRRNLTDAQIRRVADAGGVIGIAVGNTFVTGGLEGFLDHVEHAARVGGADCVAIGSDWDGAIVPVEGMDDVTCLPWVSAGLLARGHSEQNVRKFLGENALRVLTDVCG